MEINIIHRPDQIDRNSNVIDLAMLLGEAKVIQSITPLWEVHNSAKNARGYALTHLDSLYKQKTNEPILILENNAVSHHNSWKELQDNKIPDDCGVLIIGGAWDNSVDDNYFLKIESPFHGSCAIWYNTPLLRNHNFLTHAYQILASSGMGDTPNYNGLCYESVLMQALSRCGLHVYRPQNSMFTTIESKTSQLNEIILPKNSDIDIELLNK